MEDKLKQIDIENKIWIIYIGIIILSWYSNYLEKDYFLNNNKNSKDSYQRIIIIIFAILVVVYFYFLQSSYKDLKNIKPEDTDEKKLLIYLSFVGSLFVFLSGLIFLYIALNNENLDVELAFN